MVSIVPAIAPSRRFYVGALQRALQAFQQASPRPQPRWIYISTTGVYASNRDRAADESAVCQPQRPGGKASLQAEHLLVESGVSGWILRMAGLYGPDRIPRAADLTQAKPLAAFPDSLLNLIHIDDAARIVVQAADTPPRGCEILNVSDGHPVRRRDFYLEAARLLNAPPPTFQPPENAADARGGMDGKEIINQRLVQRLAPELRYPSYREGLRQALLG